MKLDSCQIWKVTEQINQEVMTLPLHSFMSRKIVEEGR